MCVKCAASLEAVSKPLTRESFILVGFCVQLRSMGKSATSSNQIAKIIKPKGKVDRAATPATSPEQIAKVSTPKDKAAKAAWARFDRNLKYAPQDLQQYI